MSWRDYAFLIVFCASLPFCFFRPFFGILAWTVISFLNPQAFTWALIYKFNWAMAIAVPTLAGFVVFPPSWKRFMSRDVLFIVLLWLWFTFTTYVNTSKPMFVHFAPDTWYRWQFVSKILVMTLATILITNTWERFRLVLLVFSGCFAILILKALPFMIITGGSFRLYGPTGSALADNNDLGLAFNMILPIFFFMSRTEESPRMRRFLKFLVIATIPAIFFTYSRGALIGLSVVLFLMFMTLRQRLMLIPVFVLAVVVALFLTPDKWQRRMDFRREGALLDDSALSRINAWTYSWRLAMDHPLTGGGFEAFTPDLFARYAPNPKDVHGSHSIYFGVLAEHGFPGLALYLALIGSCFTTLHGVKRYARRWGDRTAELYVPMLQFSLCAFMASGAFLGRAYCDYFFTIVALTISLKRLCRLERDHLAAEGIYSPDDLPLDDELSAAAAAGNDAGTGDGHMLMQPDDEFDRIAADRTRRSTES